MNDLSRPSEQAHNDPPPSQSDTVTTISKAASGWRSNLDTMFGIDIRSIAAFRVGLGILLLIDLANRAVYLTAHYTDAGILIRRTWMEHLGHPLKFSFHLMAGGTLMMSALFLLAAFFAVCLVIGWRSRLMALLSWVMLVSLQNRNPLVNNAGDAVLNLLLFFSIFLPLGIAWSVDRASNRAADPDGPHPPLQPPQRILSVGGATLLIQIASIYIFTAIIKMGGVHWQDGSAVFYALSLDHYAKAPAAFLLQYPLLLTLLSRAVIFLEFFGGLLLFSPYLSKPLRIFIISCFVSMHIGFHLCLEVGMFAFVDMISLLVFVPGVVWDTFGRWMRPQPGNIKAYYDADCTFCKRIASLLHTFLAVPGLTLHKAQDETERHEEMDREQSWILIDDDGKHWHRYDAVVELFRYSPVLRWMAPMLGFAPVAIIGNACYRWVAVHRSWATRMTRWMSSGYRPEAIQWKASAMNTMLATLLLVQISWLNIDSIVDIPVPNVIWKVVSVFRTNQYWIMFKGPRNWDGWFVIEAELVNGTKVDLMRDGAALTDEKPELVSAMYPNHRWRKAWINMEQSKKRNYLKGYIRYMVRQWDIRDDDIATDVHRVEVYFIKEYTDAKPDRPQTKKESIYSKRMGLKRDWEK